MSALVTHSSVSGYNDGMSDERLPDVFDYLDHRAFLVEWFAAKQAANPRYSHRLFASRAGSKSPSLLHLVIKGERNVTARSLPGFCRALDLDADGRAYFKLLVELDRTRSLADRNAVFERIRAKRHFRGASTLEDAGFAYLSDWTIPAIRELATCAGFRLDPAWIAARLVPRVTVPRVRKALGVLETLGMLVPDDDGGATVADASVVTAHEVWGLAAFNYHRGMIGLATDALELPGELRHYGAVTVAVPEARIPELKAAVAEFQESMLALADGEPGERVMQLNLQLFPLSEVVEDPGEPGGCCSSSGAATQPRARASATRTRRCCGWPRRGAPLGSRSRSWSSRASR
jgi:uncharacterized protein (TIGR02147 family)